jgi:hypothetical protein
MKIIGVILIVAVLFGIVGAIALSQQSGTQLDDIESIDDVKVITITEDTILTTDILDGIDQVVCSSDKIAVLTVDKSVDTSNLSITIDKGEWVLGSELNVQSVNIQSNFVSMGYSISSSSLFVGKDYGDNSTYTVDISGSIINCSWFCVYYKQSNLSLITTGSVINSQYFFGGGQTYDTIVLRGEGSMNLEDDNTINSLKIIDSVPLYVKGINRISNFERPALLYPKSATTAKAISVSPKGAIPDVKIPKFDISLLSSDKTVVK